MRLLCALACLSLLALPAVAQYDGIAPLERVPFALDIGPAEAFGDGAEQQVVLSVPVEQVGVSSLRLHFSSVELAPGATLRVTSLYDGAVQTMAAHHVQEWQDSTCYFNGPAVLLEVLAYPGSGPSRLALSELEVGVPLGGFESQCGPVDDRVPSNDPRVARLMPSICTAWLIQDCVKCFLSAGHCGLNSSVQFNVPFSTSGGSVVFPGPEDQYAIDTTSHQSSNSFGNDWQYFGTFPNSNTGLTAFQAMGDAFELVSPPSTAGNTIRITGHGADSSPNSTYNFVQQTHSGPFVSNGSPLQYQADTQGGNSGSPVIWEEGNAAIGVHTHAGCSTSGSGANQGTNINTGALQAALANPLGVCLDDCLGEAFEDLGNSLGQTFYEAPALTAQGDLSPLSTLDMQVDMPNLLNTTSFAYLVLGYSRIDQPFKGGVMVPSPDFVLTVPVDTSTADNDLELTTTWPANVPSGFVAYVQWWVTYDGPLFDGLLASNALSMTAP